MKLNKKWIEAGVWRGAIWRVGMAKTTLEVSIVVAHLHEQLVAGWCRTQIVGFSLASFSGEEGTSDVVCCNPPRRGNIVNIMSE